MYVTGSQWRRSFDSFLFETTQEKKIRRNQSCASFFNALNLTALMETPFSLVSSSTVSPFTSKLTMFFSSTPNFMPPSVMKTSRPSTRLSRPSSPF